MELIHQKQKNGVQCDCHELGKHKNLSSSLSQSRLQDTNHQFDIYHKSNYDPLSITQLCTPGWSVPLHDPKRVALQSTESGAVTQRINKSVCTGDHLTLDTPDGKCRI